MAFSSLNKWSQLRQTQAWEGLWKEKSHAHDRAGTYNCAGSCEPCPLPLHAVDESKQQVLLDGHEGLAVRGVSIEGDVDLNILLGHLWDKGTQTNKRSVQKYTLSARPGMTFNGKRVFRLQTDSAILVHLGESWQSIKPSTSMKMLRFCLP